MSNRWRLALTLAATIACNPTAQAAEIVQHFPAAAMPGAWQTCWRVVWDVVKHDGGSEILYIKEAHFRRSPSDREIQIVGDCRLAEIFVRYNNGLDYYDISNFGFSLRPLKPGPDGDLGPACIVPGRLLPHPTDATRPEAIAHEVHDDQNRWRDNVGVTGRTRRGQAMHLWSCLSAGNYQYIIKYIFRDDGQIGFRIGATAHNHDHGVDDGSTHSHTGCWRLNVVLGDAAKTTVHLVRNPTSPGGLDATIAGTQKTKLFHETRVKWNPEEFTRLLIEGAAMNDHTPPNPIGCELIPMGYGNPRYFANSEKFTQHDLWVTRDNSTVTPPTPPELQYKQLDGYANGEEITGVPTVLWHHASALHVPRDEDFGQVGYDRLAGVALTVWAGFDLKPRNFFGKTPLYP